MTFHKIVLNGITSEYIIPALQSVKDMGCKGSDIKIIETHDSEHGKVYHCDVTGCECK